KRALKFRDFGKAAATFCELEIAECGSSLAEVAKFERTFAEAASGDDADRVGHAAVYLDVGDEALAVAADWVVEAEKAHAHQRHSQAQNLASAEVPMRNSRQLFVLAHGKQGHRPQL